MPRILVTLFCWCAAASCLAQSPLSYEGIWQDINDPKSYYTLHENGDSVVLVKLADIEKTSSTLVSAYTGRKSDFVLTRVSPTLPVEGDIYNRVKMEFRSPTEGVVYPLSSTANVIVVRLRRIF
jgi:hypothetical protein